MTEPADHRRAGYSHVWPAPARENAVVEAALTAIVVLEAHDVPVPLEGDDRVDFIENLRDAIAAMVDRLPAD